ncbi:hypothetical protein DBIPINDM_005805 [Mesorhizobium sp. AR02]|uniref:hypothetical protein n=1 Tax=Mesorhizobium sp. AR02 TaxID=2865837 RepID=UPI0021603DC1|nr:hypothetical protein [Mesorhizobium sp. AR02]UVK52432.1 hypothetical protein DBIPINDM_005805 [Mesorhizobium sp. AR02]
MNRIAETFWIASALVLGVALAVIAVPIVAIVCFLALALPGGNAEDSSATQLRRSRFSLHSKWLG